MTGSSWEQARDYRSQRDAAERNKGADDAGSAARGPAGLPEGKPGSVLSLRTMDDATWHALLQNAERLAGPVGRRALMAGKRFGMLLLAPSLRTRTSFEVGCADLGAHAVHLAPGNGLWELETRTGVVMDGDRAEHVREAVGVLSRMVDGLGVRVFAGLEDAEEDASDAVLASIVRAATVPVLNLESAADHPHQGLADALTLRRRFDGRHVRVVLRWAPHVKPLPRAVAQAALVAFAREGHEVIVCHPRGFELDPGALADARAFAAAAGGSVDVVHARDGGLDDAQVIYAKSWLPAEHHGDPEGAAAFLADRRDWIVDERTLAAARRNVVFMHCLPIRRGVVATDGVLDGPHSIVLDQAEARLHVQKATLCRAAAVPVPGA